MKQVPCSGPHNIKCPHIKFSTPCDLEPEIFCQSIRMTTEGCYTWGPWIGHTCKHPLVSPIVAEW